MKDDGAKHGRPFFPRTMEFSSPKGLLRIEANRPQGSFDGLRFEEGLGKFDRYSSIIRNVDALAGIAEKPAGKVTIAVKDDSLVVGYVVGWRPAPDERWSALGDLMYEIAAVEASRNYRGMGLATKLLGITMDEEFFEDKIAFMQGYSWHWDFEGAGLTPGQYRSMMMSLFERFGFREVYTNEPNIALRPENLMMIRLGPLVTEEEQKRFRYLRFGIKPDSLPKKG